MVRFGEIGFTINRFYNLLMVGKLFAIVESDSMDPVLDTTQQVNNSICNRFRCLLCPRESEPQFRLALSSVTNTPLWPLPMMVSASHSPTRSRCPTLCIDDYTVGNAFTAACNAGHSVKLAASSDNYLTARSCNVRINNVKHSLRYVFIF